MLNFRFYSPFKHHHGLIENWHAFSHLRSEGITIEKAYLYGSHLSDTPTDESDIDILIVTENEADYLTGKIWSLARKVNTKIEPYFVSKGRFNNNVYSPLIDLAKRTGLEIA